jgi:diaminohydroxyphosphoribosylaminopyrimidine deaminase / 5-amino-6-(5-phosphoribosylamino)uracil reductase
MGPQRRDPTGVSKTLVKPVLPLNLRIDWAWEEWQCTEPNPRVLCKLNGAAGGHSLQTFQGHTQPPGRPHAEVMALRAAQAAGVDVRGATAWVTLEPCAHHGRTPPCCDALVAAGVGRVVVALVDPNPLVAGQGIARMRAAGIDVQVAGSFTGAFADRFAAEHPDDPQGLAWAREAFELNIGFFSRMVRGRPWVRMKIAASLDGQTALANGASQWITSPEARADGHAWRRRAGAVLTGIGTVRDDDPRLDVRLVETQRQPLRVVVDSRLEINPGARILQPPGQVLVCCAQGHAASDKARALTRFTVTDADRAAKLMASRAGAQAAPGIPGPTPVSQTVFATPRLEVAGPWEGVEVVGLPSDERGKTDLAALMAELAHRQVNELHVEAGHQLNGSLLKAGLVDELLVYLAPKMLGPGRGMAAFGPLEQLADGLELEFVECTPVGPDLRIRARPPGRAGFFPLGGPG